MNLNELVSEQLALLGVINNASNAAATYLTGAVNTNLFRRLFFVINLGTVGGGGTVDFQVTAAATSGGSYSAVSGTAITQLTAANKIVTVELRAEQLTSLGVGPYVKGSLVVAVAACVVTVEVWGACARYAPASDSNIAGLAQQVTL